MSDDSSPGCSKSLPSFNSMNRPDGYLYHIKIAIIGCGPRGLLILDRISSLVDKNTFVTVHVIDPHNVFGGGVHPSNQPAYLWVNTVAEQVTMFADSSVDQSIFGAVTDGPSLFEWCKDNSYHFDELTHMYLGHY